MEVFEPAAPLIRKNVYAKSIDQTYREMERQSADRAEEAASILEDSFNAQPRDAESSGLLQATQREQVAQLKSELKITDMADPSSLREGDTSVVNSASAAAQRLSIGASRPGFQQMGGAVPNHAPGVGPAHAGSGALSLTTGHQGWTDGTPANPNPQHNARASAMIRAGQIGAYNETR